MDNLPYDVLCIIFDYLDDKSFVNFIMTSKSNYEYLHDQLLQRKIFGNNEIGGENANVVKKCWICRSNPYLHCMPLANDMEIDDIFFPNKKIRDETKRKRLRDFKTDRKFLVPLSVKKLTLSNFFNSPIEITENVKTIKICDTFNQQLYIPKNVISLKIGNKFNNQITFEDDSMLERLTIGKEFNWNLILPEKLKYLRLGSSFNRKIILPNGLKEIYIIGNFNQAIEIPDSVTHIILHGRFQQTIKFTRNVVYLDINLHNYIEEDIKLIPKSILKCPISSCHNFTYDTHHNDRYTIRAKIYTEYY
jgi:hypothetical protein